MVVCIAGMHRSGTSMIARALNLCGLYLGATHDLLAPEPDNPEGFWEHVGFLRINNELLNHFGGGWDLPPVFPADWPSAAGIAPFAAEARTICQAFAGKEPWGWKDPRNSLTLQFWEAIVSSFKTVVCVRNPEEVARSLYTRGASSSAFSYNLWTRYNEALLHHLQPGDYIVTRYEAYFQDPLAELERVCRFLELPATGEQLQVAASTAKPALHRQRVSSPRLPPAVAALYKRLCKEAAAR